MVKNTKINIIKTKEEKQIPIIAKGRFFLQENDNMPKIIDIIAKTKPKEIKVGTDKKPNTAEIIA